MDRREMFGVVGAAAAGLGFTAGNEASGELATSKTGDGYAECSCQCVESCTNCMNCCNESYLHCFHEVGKAKPRYAKAMQLCVDCGEVSGTAAKLVARESAVMSHICQAGAATCEDCIAECEKLDDPKMKEAIESMRKCAVNCRAMLKIIEAKK
jgi:hypothetical protein